MICKHCGKEIHKGEVWNPDENGNGYHHKCLIDMEFDENEAYLKDLKNRSIVIPKGATIGDMVKAMFPNCEVSIHEYMGIKCGVDVKIYFSENESFTAWFPSSLWNAPYKKGE